MMFERLFETVATRLHEEETQVTAEPKKQPAGDILYVPSDAHKLLWEGELLQQLVDGAYMNRVNDPHRWESMQVKVDLSRKTPVLYTSETEPLVGNFPFEQDVVPVVGGRMLGIVQADDPEATEETVKEMCRDFHLALKSPRTEKIEIAESVKLTEDMDADDFLEVSREFMSSAAEGFLAASNKSTWRVYWPKLQPARLKKIWTDYARTGVIRDEKGMGDIAKTMFDMVARLHAANAISGHDSYDPRPEIEEMVGEAFSDEEWHQFVEGMVHNDKGEWLVSDYGLPKLEKLAFALAEAEGDAEQQLLIVDQMLNVIHQRGDLAAMFVEGGTKVLDFLRDQ